MKLTELNNIQGNDGLYLIHRKLWIALANDQFTRRKRIFGSQANVCRGCTEILMCTGPVSFQVCQALDELIKCGYVTGPKKIKYSRLRRKWLPISKECLEAYGILRKENE